MNESTAPGFVGHYNDLYLAQRKENEKRRRALEVLAARFCGHCIQGGCVHCIARQAINAPAEVEALRKIAERKCEACDGRRIPEVDGQCAHVVARKALES